MPEARNIKLTIEYDGTGFAGWQRQRGQPSIQAEVECAIEALTGQRVTVIGAGRTDAGVHALGQVASFRTTSRLEVPRIPAALNAHLPPTVTVLRAEEVSASFHARRSATGRTYRYVVLNRPAPSAILRHHAYHVASPLDPEAIAEASPALRGTHAFTAFRGIGSGESSTICTLRTAEITRKDDLVIFTFEADRFLRHMVRMIVGTLIRVGAGKLAPEAVGELLAAEDNRRTGPTAPAHGLFLVRVTYGDQ